MGGNGPVGEIGVETYTTEIHSAPEKRPEGHDISQYDRYSAGSEYFGCDGSEPLAPLKEDDSKSDDPMRKLKTATIFVLCFFFVEVIGGIWAGSLAVITDAAHLLTDISVSSSCELLYCYRNYTYTTVNTVVL